MTVLDRRITVTCPDCGMTTLTDPQYAPAAHVLHAHRYGSCTRLPLWRRWLAL